MGDLESEWKRGPEGLGINFEAWVMSGRVAKVLRASSESPAARDFVAAAISGSAFGLDARERAGMGRRESGRRPNPASGVEKESASAVEETWVDATCWERTERRARLRASGL